MIQIVPKPTDTPGDDSTGQVIAALKSDGAHFAVLDLDRIDPYSTEITGDLIWVCGMKQDGHQFDTLQILSLDNCVINHPEAIVTCASKPMTTALLRRCGVPTPDTIFTSSPEAAADFIERYGTVVFKPPYGFDGNGIERINRPDQLGSPPFYLQEYIPNDRDFRVFVIEGEVVGAIERVSDTLTHNIHQGGIGRPVEIDERMRDITGMAAGAIGIGYCGVDLLAEGDGYTVLEVNGTPNWHCMAAPIPMLLARYLIRQEQEFTK